jgi:hypothetical protein
VTAPQIDAGPPFRVVNRHGRVLAQHLSAEGVTLVLKRRVEIRQTHAPINRQWNMLAAGRHQPRTSPTTYFQITPTRMTPIKNP